ncbi:hypothetical protein WN51_05903 [Melipona quadrifasciata]|uniref:Uncharacterized protein n=1 Tax=Melipona quadrifasciata TaxID=166423 RepID=A0A0M9A647_9HYME|nr:hypothetical protein WN51_05903 [Melipona quadrifasciata]
MRELLNVLHVRLKPERVFKLGVTRNNTLMKLVNYCNTNELKPNDVTKNWSQPSVTFLRENSNLMKLKLGKIFTFMRRGGTVLSRGEFREEFQLERKELER